MERGDVFGRRPNVVTAFDGEDTLVSIAPNARSLTVSLGAQDVLAGIDAVLADRQPQPDEVGEDELNEERGYDPNKRLYNDLTTMFAEMADGQMRTPFEYRFDGQEFFAEDGSAIRPIFDDSLADAERIVARNPLLGFEKRRRYHERAELSDMEAMARGEQGNTMIVVSDFPAELMGATEDVGGYNVTRRQTMLRVLVWRDGTLKMYSQTLDGSDRQALEAIYEFFGKEARPGELLGQRIHIELPDDAQDGLTDKLTNIYDTNLAARKGGNWHAGRPAEDGMVNTYDFVRAQHDLVQRAMTLHRSGRLNGDEIYNTMAAITCRLREFRSVVSTVDPDGYIAPSTYVSPLWNLEQELQLAGKEAREAGQTFSACGVSLGSSEEGSSSDQLASAGYGNKSESSADCVFISKKCPMCGTKNVRTLSTATFVKGSCGCFKKKVKTTT